jgi:CubicO group peptidase (beta-lactamase class C family)
MFFDENIVREVTTPIVNPQGTEFEFATGWKTNYSFDNTYIFGNYAPNLTYGHDGWTGTMTVIDPVNHLTICILTNSIHTPLYNHDSNGSLFFGKHRYFLPEGTASSLNRIGMVVSNWVYEACNTLKK